MPVEQMNISISPRMAKFIRRKVKAGGYTNVSEVVRAAVRRMQEEEAREAKLADSAVEALLKGFSDTERALIGERVHSGFAAIEQGEYHDYVGRSGLDQLAQNVKSRGRKLLAGRSRNE